MTTRKTKREGGMAVSENKKRHIRLMRSIFLTCNNVYRLLFNFFPFIVGVV